MMADCSKISVDTRGSAIFLSSDSEDSEASTVVCDLAPNDETVCTLSPVALPASTFMQEKENIMAATNSLNEAFDKLQLATPKQEDKSICAIASGFTSAEPCTERKRTSNLAVPMSHYKTPFETRNCASQKDGSKATCADEEDDDLLFHTAYAPKTRRRVVSSSDEEETVEQKKNEGDYIDLSKSADSSSSSDEPTKPLRRRLRTPFRQEIYSVTKIRKEVEKMELKNEVIDIISDSGDDSSFIDKDDDDFLSVGSTKKVRNSYADQVKNMCQDNVRLDVENRDGFIKQLLRLFNKAVFNNAIPTALKVSWNVRLTKTAGVTYTSVKDGERICRIELSTKVVDTFYRLKTTFLHECCHVAAWLVQGSNKPPHGMLYNVGYPS